MPPAARPSGLARNPFDDQGFSMYTNPRTTLGQRAPAGGALGNRPNLLDYGQPQIESPFTGQGTGGSFMVTPPGTAENIFGQNYDREQRGSDRTLAQQLEGQRQAGETGRAQLAYNANIYPQQLRQSRFDQILPLLRGGLASFLQAGTAPGGASGQGPEITAGPIWTEAQIQQQVNSQRGANDMATAGRIRGSRQDLAGRGYGGNSPLAQALQAQFQGQNLATNTANERETRFNLSRGNAQQLLASQTAREAQNASRQDEDIRRRQQSLGSYNALIAALGGLV